MFYAMVFIKNEYGFFTVRTLRKPPYKTINAAKKAIQKKRQEGYIKEYNNPIPVWNNVYKAS